MKKEKEGRGGKKRRQWRERGRRKRREVFSSAVHSMRWTTEGGEH